MEAVNEYTDLRVRRMQYRLKRQRPCTTPLEDRVVISDLRGEIGVARHRDEYLWAFLQPVRQWKWPKDLFVDETSVTSLDGKLNLRKKSCT